MPLYHRKRVFLRNLPTMFTKIMKVQAGKRKNHFENSKFILFDLQSPAFSILFFPRWPNILPVVSYMHQSLYPRKPSVSSQPATRSHIPLLALSFFSSYGISCFKLTWFHSIFLFLYSFSKKEWNSSDSVIVKTKLTKVAFLHDWKSNSKNSCSNIIKLEC